MQADNIKYPLTIKNVFARKLNQYEGVYISGEYSPNPFELAYIDIRHSEGRVLDDQAVMKLPFCNFSEPLSREWTLREKSAMRMNDYLTRLPDSSHLVLEVGCGNGWFTNLIGQNHATEVVGLDINMSELVQARRIFKSEKIHFCYVDIFSREMVSNTFDLIIFNASFQYFPNLAKTLDRCFQLLAPGGEVHIIDTAFYERSELFQARQRSLEYFDSAGQKEMSQYYFHHCFDDLTNYKYDLLYQPKKESKKPDNPFPWVRLQQA